ncbi:MAG: hypothetical protein H5U40_18760 [Polyangiaceae bacterium]|nr:hypothetical protein [Polyangiaceae bacterium]
MSARAALPTIVFVVCAALYAAMLGDRALVPSTDNHYSHLAQSWLDGQLHLGSDPPGTNDWACFDTEERGPCPNNRYTFGNPRYRWYVSFPPFPAAVILPAVALYGVDVPDRLFWALFAGLGPALLYVLLRRLRETLGSRRSIASDLLLTALFAFGSVYFFVAVQGTVWFAAHVVATPLVIAYLLFSLEARRPLLAGLFLGLAFLCRPTTALLAIFFFVQALRVSRDEAIPEGGSLARRSFEFLRPMRPGAAATKLALFALPLVAIGALAMWHNHARFGDWFEWGHSYLQIRWRQRIERWGLFNYHYLSRNLAVFLASLPWLSASAPHVVVSRHGLALWVTTPGLLFALWPKRLTATMVALAAATVPVLVVNLMYQNSGWVQFGYRFALDYLPLVFALLALGGRRFGPGFLALAVFSFAINAFGAATFDRRPEFYDHDATQQVYFQPD